MKIKGLQSLTPQERKVVELAASGMIDKEIARELGVQPSTLNGYWTRIRLKLRVSTRTEAAVVYMQQELGELSDEILNLKESIEHAQNLANTCQRDASSMQMILDGLPCGIVRVDPIGNVAYCNREFAELLSLSTNQVVGSSILTLVDTSSAAKIKDVLSKRREGISSDFEINIRVGEHGSGRLCISGTPLHDEAGEHIGSVATVTRKHLWTGSECVTSHQIDPSFARMIPFDELVHLAPFGVVVTDQRDRVIYCNQAFEGLAMNQNVLHQTIFEALGHSGEVSSSRSAGTCLPDSCRAVRDTRSVAKGVLVDVKDLDQTKKLIASIHPIDESFRISHGLMLVFADATDRAISKTTVDWNRFAEHLDLISDATDSMKQVLTDLRFR